MGHRAESRMGSRLRDNRAGYLIEAHCFHLGTLKCVQHLREEMEMLPKQTHSPLLSQTVALKAQAAAKTATCI